MTAPIGKHAIISEALDWKLNQLVFSPVLRITQRDLSFEPRVGETYLRNSYLPNQTDFGEVGGNLRRHRGLYQVDVVGPTNKGPIPQTEIVDLVIEHFVSQLISRNGATVRIGSFDGSSAVPYPAPEIVANGWRTIPITIPWWCDTF